MKNLKFIISGAIFGIILYKSEVISWFRVQEMFRFQSFHMFGVIGSAILVGLISLYLIKKLKIKSLTKESIQIPSKKIDKGYIFGGVLFGMGWALTGACPGPLYAHLGAGTSVMIVSLISAFTGTWAYSYLRPQLPH